MRVSSLVLSGLLTIGLAIVSQATDLAKIDLSKLPAPAPAKGLTYAKDIKPLLDASCVRCHGQERPKAGLQLTSLEAILKGGKEGKVIVPGDSKQSLLVIAAAQIDEETAMPPKPRPGRGGPGGPSGAQPPGGPPSGGPQQSPRGPGGPGGLGGFGPPPKPLTLDQVALLRAWVDQGAK